MKFEVEFYETKNGIQPAREFILSQEKKFIAKTLDMIQLSIPDGFTPPVRSWKPSIPV